MKRFILIFSALFLSFLASARIVSRDEALSYAAEVLNTSVANLSLAWTGVNPGSTPALYAINSSKGGFVVISGTDCINPVIGYSYEGSFKTQGMPENIKAFFTGIEEDLRYVETKNICLKPAQKGLWNIAESGTKASYPASASLTTATWDQDSPYNQYCVFGYACPTGCVATAMAIIYRFHKHPAKGTGKTDAYKTSSNISIPSIDLSKSTYEWDKMPLKDEDVQGTSEDKKQAIALIMRDCGRAIRMDYASNGSSAFSFNVPKVSVENMGYDPSTIRYDSKSLHPASEWIDMIKTEISSQRPVYYSAQDTKGTGGHAFVIDGYDSKGYFHLNWGWGGINNGNFTLELSVSTYRFSSSQNAVFGIKPAKTEGGTVRDMLVLESAGLKLVGGSIEKSTKFAVSVDYIHNVSAYQYTGKLRLALVDKTDKVKASFGAKDVSYKPTNKDGSYFGFRETFSDAVFDCDVDLSDKVVLQYLDNSSKEFVNMPYDRESGARGFLIPLKYNFIAAPSSSYKVGDIFDFEIIAGVGYQSAKWYVNGEETSDPFISLTKAGTYKVKAVLTTEEGTETIVQEVVVK